MLLVTANPLANRNAEESEQNIHVDRAGEVRQAWSWKTGDLAAVEPKEELKSVSAFGGAPLVSVRPETADIGPSIREGRRVRVWKVSWTPKA